MWSQAGCVDWFLIKNVEVEARDHLERTCLHYASCFGNYQVVHTLLRRSADVNAVDINGDTPLLCALHEYDNNDKSEIIQLLLEYGANLAHSNKYGRNPIHVCACTGDVETLELLLEKSCSEEVTWNLSEGEVDVEAIINIRDNFGLTAVHIAAGNTQYDILEYLIQQGANPISWTRHNALPCTRLVGVARSTVLIS
jgi:ankyrin repeat protein